MDWNGDKKLDSTDFIMDRAIQKNLQEGKPFWYGPWQLKLFVVVLILAYYVYIEYF